ncbi:hypothetical protein TNCV_4492251 [Trichonephila clavipes]|nr:hypothetical protein TNCV_4492251 [Trichonephila clavipes]
MGDELPDQWREFLSRHRSHSFPALPIPKTRRKLARPLAGKPSAIGDLDLFGDQVLRWNRQHLSSIGVGAVLNQEQRPVVFASRTLSAAERNYMVIERGNV